VGRQRLGQPALARDQAHQLDLGTGQVDRRGHHPQVVEVLGRGGDLGQ
jgi:hypothetical protein